MALSAILIADAAKAHEGDVVKRRGGDLVVAVSLRRNDGRFTLYNLSIDGRTSEPTVRERTTEHLPSFCPDRHINADGTFCLSWTEADPIPVRDVSSANEWWSCLIKYLQLQEATTQLRRWPSTRQWAHGGAADAQLRAEMSAAALGPEFRRALDGGRLRVVRAPHRAAFVALFDGRRRLYSIWEKAERVVTLRQHCLCGSRLTIRECADHAKQAVELVRAIQEWTAAEQAFWRQYAGHSCCGTLATCPLNPVLAPPRSTQLTAQAA